MLINHFIRAGEFGYCTTYFAPHSTHSNLNDGDGHYHQVVYVLDGGGISETRDVEGTDTPAGVIQPLVQGELFRTEANVDESEYFGPYGKDSRGLWITTITGDRGCCTVLFNPIPASRRLDVNLVKGKDQSSYTIEPQEKRTTIVCLTGPIYVNDKKMITLQHAKVFPGKTAEIKLTEHSVCALVQSESMDIDEALFNN